MKLFSLRLHPDEDLRSALQKFAAQEQVRAGSILTCVGALKSATLRMAGATPDKQVVNTYHENFEIVSLAGTITADDCHLHIALAKENGEVIGGHLKSGSIVDVTAEVVIAEDENATYSRVMDNETGFEELLVTPR